MSSFDFAISIAVVHHLSTTARRVEAIREILMCLRPTLSNHVPSDTDCRARVLIFVWALEQKTSRRGWDEGDEQDVMVPWVMKQSDGPNKSEQSRTFKRYYHLYRHGELERDVMEAGGVIVESGYERDNWWVVAVRPG